MNCVTIQCVEVQSCDCSGFSTDNSGQCGVNSPVSYTIPVDASNISAVTNITGASVVSVTANTAMIFIPCTDTGIDFAGTLTVSYELPGIPSICECTVNLNIANTAEPTIDCTQVIYLQ